MSGAALLKIQIKSGYYRTGQSEYLVRLKHSCPDPSLLNFENYNMKIITWNACCKFREKYSLLSQYDADILVIQQV